jgi:16S rRNA (cytidine1402-2'-O)-methyltransferase
VLDALKRGQDVAYASDAGTPAISDPGSVLVRIVRDAGYTVVPIPGASAFATLVSVAGLQDKSVVFEGFLSPKPGRRRSRLRELMDSGYASVVYESPFRIVKLLADVAEIDGEREIVVGRELTKLHEEIASGTARTFTGILPGGIRFLANFPYIYPEKNAQFPTMIDRYSK